MFDKLQAFMISLSISFTSHDTSLVYFIHRKSFDNATLLYQVYVVSEYNFYDFNNSKLACFVQIHITCPLFSLTSLTFGLKVRHSWVLEIVCDWNIIDIDLGEDNTWLAGLKHILYWDFCNVSSDVFCNFDIGCYGSALFLWCSNCCLNVTLMMLNLWLVWLAYS